MNFIQPFLLAGLPLIGLPILIHLLNRQRHRTIPWGAMMFLLDAKRMTRGMARLKHWLIMAMRMLAVGGLVFAVSRPLASGWFGSALGGQADTTILILDRSASMEQQDVQTGQTKRSTALGKLHQLLETLGGKTRLVLIESAENQAREIDSAQSLLDSPDTTGTATSADLAAMLQTAQDYVVASQTGRTDIWICSDLRENDWQADDGRWAAIRQGFERLEGIRFYLLTYPNQARGNVAVRVRNVRRRQIGEIAELVLDVELQRSSGATAVLNFPLEFVINGARSILPIEMSESNYALQGHTIPLDVATEAGWGRVELPADANLADNVFYFVFAQPPEYHTTIVADDTAAAAAIQAAAVSPADPAISYASTLLPSDRSDEIDWDATSLLVWQAPLPTGVTSRQVESFVAGGRPALFLPPEVTGAANLFGMTWGDWHDRPPAQSLGVATWRGDSDLLAHTNSGTPLPVNKLQTTRYRSIEGGRALARLADGQPLLSRAATEQGPVYFLATLPNPRCSTLAQDGVVFYVMLQRALAVGAATQGAARQLTAGSTSARQVSNWRPLSQSQVDTTPSFRALQSGALQQDERLVALNRPESEDSLRTIDESELSRLFGGLNYRQVEDQVGNSSALANEVWRAFLVAMAAALIIEAALCLPEPKKALTV